VDADHNNKKRKRDTVERSIFLDQSGSTPEVGTLTIGSLFSGIGGFELGFEATGRFETRWQVECDPYATKVLEKHWPDVVRHDDVCTWPKATTEPVDVLLAGFPCQDISYAGKGAGLDGERSGLFYEVMRTVREMGPRYVVLENVSALLTRGMGDVLGSLSSHRYDAEWEVVSAASVGAPHRRDRVFVIGSKICDSCGKGKPTSTVNAKTSKLQDDVADSLSAGTGDQNGTTRGQKREPSGASESATLRQGDWEALPEGVNASGGDTRNLANADDSRDRTPRRRTNGNREKTIEGWQERSQSEPGGHSAAQSNSKLADPSDKQCKGCEQETVRRESRLSRQLGRSSTDQRTQWATEPSVGRVANGVPQRMDRLRCLGNAIVPQVAKVVADRLLQIHDAEGGE